MNLILRWFLDKMSDAFVDCFEIIRNMASVGFDNTIVKAILSVAKSIGLPLIGIAILVLIIKSIINLMDNKQIEFGNILSRIVMGVVIYMFGVPTMKYFFLFLLDTGQTLINVIAEIDEFDVSVFDFVGMSKLFTLILLVIAIYHLVKCVLHLLERFWLYLLTLIMLYIYLPGYIAGSDESIILWFKQCVGIALTQILQTLILVMGMNIFASGGTTTDFCLCIGALMGAGKTDRILDKWGQPAGGSVGGIARNGMSSVFYARQIFARG